MKISGVKDFVSSITRLMGVVNTIDDNSNMAVLNITTLNDLIMPNGESKVLQTGKMIQARKDELLIIRASETAKGNNLIIVEHEILPGEKTELIFHITNVGIQQAEIGKGEVLAEVFSIAVVSAKAAEKTDDQITN